MATKILVWDYGYLEAGEPVHALLTLQNAPNKVICTTDSDDGHFTIPVYMLADSIEHFEQLREEEKRLARVHRGRYTFEQVWLNVQIRR
jgi:hypothetical protein